MVIICTTAGFGGPESFGFRAATPDGNLRHMYPIGTFVASIFVTRREIGNDGGLGAGKVRAQLCRRTCHGLPLQQMHSSVRGFAAISGTQRWSCAADQSTACNRECFSDVA